VQGLIAAALNRLLAGMGVQEGVVDQRGEIGQITGHMALCSGQDSRGWITPNPPWLRRYTT
jgi:hypothetical protein